MEITNYVYQASNGESFDSVAMELWDQERYAAELLCANPEHSHKMVFQGGERLRIPYIELPTGDDTLTEPAKAPWKD